jgi:hypothetical protein
LSERAILRSLKLSPDEKEKMLQVCDKFGKAPTLQFYLKD